MLAILALMLSAAPTPADWAKAAKLTAGYSRFGNDRELADRPIAADDVSAMLERLTHDCLAHDVACYDIRGEHPEAEHEERLEVLISLLGETGTHRDLSLLDRLDARGYWYAGRAATHLLEREWQAALPPLRKTCTPPSAETISREAEHLSDFFVVNGRTGSAMELSKTERDDLAYFLSSVDRTATEVGADVPDNSVWTQEGKQDPALDALAAKLTAVGLRGDPRATAKVAHEYLGLLGYPGRITGTDEFGWHGARFSNVMRELGDALERTGDFGEAALLQRTANPGGGMCGTGASARWSDQLQAVIRNTERAGGCATAERLLEIQGRFGPPYGTSELTARGFDLKRLYRGAALTLGREDGALLKAALQRLPPASRDRALTRLEHLGREAWEPRVHALEGLAALAGPGDFEPVVSTIERAGPDAAERGLEALATRVRHPEYDPCGPTTTFGGGYGSEWSREVSPLGEACETRLTGDEEAALARRLLTLEGWSSGPVRLGLARTLDALSSTEGSATLARFAEPTELEGLACEKEHWVCQELRKIAAEGQARIAAAKHYGPRPARPK